MEYLHWKEETITDFSDSFISKKYNEGFVFTRKGKGVMHQTRSARVDLNKFELSSENRRVLKKVAGLKLSQLESLPMSVGEYQRKIAGMIHDFYSSKFGANVFSKNKAIEILINSDKSNFNYLLNFKFPEGHTLAFCIAYKNNEMLHYSYPFYSQNEAFEPYMRDIGLGMMTTTLQWAKEKGLKYVYLGSLQRPGDVYKLQFSGLEWFDGTTWKNDLGDAKKVLK